MTHLVVSGNKDLGSGLILVSVVIDIERMGDYTKNIYDLAIQHPKRLKAGNYENQLQDIASATAAAESKSSHPGSSSLECPVAVGTHS